MFRPNVCLLFAVPFALISLSASCGSEPRAAHRNVILLTIDTLRADHVGAGAGGQTLTPHIDRLAAEGAAADWALAPMPRTTQSVASILTGLHPLRHGADGLNMPLRASCSTLAELLSAAGYESAAMTSNFVLRPGMGFEQGFSLYSNTRPRWEGDSAPMLSEEALAWVRGRSASDTPFFLWVHYLDPHWPYSPPEDLAQGLGADPRPGRDLRLRMTSGELSEGELIFSAEEELGASGVRNLQSLYAAEVRATDRAIGTLVDGLAEIGVLDASVLLLTADHGESLGAHDYWFAHGEYLYDDTLRVPLLVRAPGLIAAGQRIEGTVRLEDVLPTICDLTGVELPQGLDGMSLASWLRGGRDGGPGARDTVHLTDHRLVRPENPRRPVGGRDGRWWALADGEHKLIQIPLPNGGFEEELYAVQADPGEQHNLAGESGNLTGELRGRLAAARQALLAAYAAIESEASPEESGESRKILESLGYVGSLGADTTGGSRGAPPVEALESPPFRLVATEDRAENETSHR